MIFFTYFSFNQIFKVAKTSVAVCENNENRFLVILITIELDVNMLPFLENFKKIDVSAPTR